MEMNNDVIGVVRTQSDSEIALCGKKNAVCGKIWFLNSGFFLNKIHNCLVLYAELFICVETWRSLSTIEEKASNDFVYLGFNVFVVAVFALFSGRVDIVSPRQNSR